MWYGVDARNNEKSAKQIATKKEALIDAETHTRGVLKPAVWHSPLWADPQIPVRFYGQTGY